MECRDRKPETIVEDVEKYDFSNRENLNPNGQTPSTKNETPNSCRKRNPLGIRNRNRNRASPSSHSSPCRNHRLVPNSANQNGAGTQLPTPSPRCLRNPFDQGGVIMSPGAINCPSGAATPSSVSSSGWTIDQRAALFPAQIEDNLIDTQYESPYSSKGLEKSKSALESWLQQTDLTSPWSTKKDKSLNKSRPGNKSFRMVDQSTQTGFTLPLNFNLMQFLEEHGVPIQTVPDQTSSANSSLRRKLFDCDQASDSDESDAGDNLPNILLRSPPRDAQIIPEAKTTPQAGSEQFSSSPIKISPVLSSPGALSYCGGELESPLALASPYRSPFRSPFGDPNISLSPIPKAKDDQTPSKGRHLRFNKSPIQFNGTKDFESDSDGEENTIETKTEKINTVNKSRFESLDTSFDVSMKSNEWDSIQKNSKDAESTRIQRHKSRLDEEDVYMMSFSQESRGFSFCEANENTNENTNETKDENIDSGISSNPNSRTGSVLFEKQIPQPVFSMIYEAKEPTDPN